MAFTPPPSGPASAPPAPTMQDDNQTFSTKADAFVMWQTGFATWVISFVNWILTFLSEITAAQTDITNKSASATANANAAAASAVSALAAPGTSATSSTTLTIATSQQSLAVQAGKAFVTGMTVKIATVADPTIWMLGDIVSYNSGTGALVVAITDTQNAGTSSSWTVSICAPLSRVATEYLQDSLQYLPNGLLAKEVQTIAGFPSENSYLYYPNGLVKSKTRRYRGRTRVESFYLGQNLFAYPNDFTNAVWTTIGPLSPFSAVIDGKYATKWTSLNVTSFHYFCQSVAFSKTGAYTLSFFVASAGVRYVQLLWSGTVSFNYVNFDLQTGTICNAGNFELGTIAPVPGGYVISITSNITNITTDNVFICLINSATSSRGEPFIGDGAKGIFISSAQVSFGTKQPYVSNYQFAGRASTGSYFDQSGIMQSAAANVPRWSYDPADLSKPPVLLNEPASTNLLLNSATLANQTVATAAGQQYTLSFYGSGSVSFTGAAGPALVGADANTRVSYTLTALGSSISLTVSGAVSYSQFEPGTAPTSWIATTGSTATRAADQAISLPYSDNNIAAVAVQEF